MTWSWSRIKYVQKKFWAVNTWCLKIDENHRKTKFPTILMSFEIRIPFFSLNYHEILPHLMFFDLFLIFLNIFEYFWPFLIVLIVLHRYNSCVPTAYPHTICMLWTTGCICCERLSSTACGNPHHIALESVPTAHTHSITHVTHGICTCCPQHIVHSIYVVHTIYTESTLPPHIKILPTA